MNCVACGKQANRLARRLCATCYSYHSSHDNLIDFPRVTRSHEETMSEYLRFKELGYNIKDIADKLGMNIAALRRAVQRSRDKHYED